MANDTAYLSSGDLVRAAERLDPPELERLVADLLALMAQRKASALAESEAELLQRINRGLPAGVQRRYDLLVARRQTEDLSPV